VRNLNYKPQFTLPLEKNLDVKKTDNWQGGMQSTRNNAKPPMLAKGPILAAGQSGYMR